jgi:transposase
MRKMVKLGIGIDISKALLDVATYPETETQQFTNNTKGIRALIKWLTRLGQELIVFEPTGAYHRTLERALAEAALAYAKINPRQARRFAEATGKLAKTDRVDARMLARFGAQLQPPHSESKRQSLETLAELVVARRGLVKDRTAAKNRRHTVNAPLLKRQILRRLKQIDADIAAIESECRALVDTDEDLSRRFDILMSVPGLGEITIITMLAEMPELGSMDKRQAAALAGLAPITRQSGSWRGKSFIQGGRASLRQALFMPALVACRFNPVLKAKYQHLKAAGKLKKVAITAVMRKLIIIANALIRDNRKWSNKTA